MKLPSLASLARGAIAAFLRFPLAITGAVTGTVFGILLVRLSYNGEDTQYWYWNALMSCYLGMMLQVAVVVFVERKGFAGPVRRAAQLAGAVVTIIYYASLPAYFAETSVTRFLLFALGLHLLIAFVPFTGKGEQNGFWQYNKALFFRILISALYTIVLGTGLSLALLAVEKLFGVDINERLYSDLWVSLTGIFSTWYFLAGFPRAYVNLEGETDYPKGLKIFTQYVLLPIIVIYLGILYVYMLKIIFTAQWPEGWVSYLVLGFSVGGILSILLIYPVRDQEKNKWMPAFFRFFYFALLPLLALLCCAIGKRINDYGITELRYFVLLLAAWLVFIAVYWLASAKKNIKVIPVSLCLLAFLSSAGPWSAFDVSRRSQLRRWTSLLEKDKLLQGGKAVKSTSLLPFKDRKQISAATEYLVTTHGYELLQPYFVQNLDSILSRKSIDRSPYSPNRVDTILALMRLSYVGDNARDDYGETDGSLYYNVEDADNVRDIREFDYVISNYAASARSDDSACSAYLLGGDPVKICFDSTGHHLIIAYNAEPVININMDSVLGSMQGKTVDSIGEMKQKDMTLYVHSRARAYKFVFKYMNGEREDSLYHVSDFQADIFIGRSNKKQ